MKHPPLNIIDACLLAGFKYQLSISSKIAEERFDKLMEDASDYAKSVAMKWLSFSDVDPDWWWKNEN